jgi:hypothetical protein
MLRGATGGHGGAAEGCRGMWVYMRLWGAMRGAPMVLRVTDFTDPCFLIQKLLVDTNKQISMVQGTKIYFSKKLGKFFFVFSL